MTSNLTISEANAGWVNEPDGRGTWAILSSCFFTIFLCCWTSVCPNIPAKNDGDWSLSRDKFNLACIGLLGPEFLLMLALGQWTSARNSVKDFHASGYKDWSLTHAFFADMGGFLLDAPGSPELPLDAKQLHYLVMNGYVEYPALTRGDIEDRDKAGCVAKFLTICQAVWFSVNCIVRLSQGLFLTTLELTTLSFIVILYATAYSWYRKPLDVSRAITVKTATPIEVIREREGQTPDHKWHQTPLDFLSRQEWFCSLFWRYYILILHHLRIPLFSRPITSRPYNRIPSDNFPPTDLLAELVCAPIIILFSSTFIFAWNFEFPTAAEHLLWRIASTVMLVFGIGGGIFSGYCDKLVLKERKLRKWSEEEWAKHSKGGPFETLVMRMRNIDPERDPELEVPLRVLVPLSVLCSLYCLCRMYIFVEDIIALRSLPPSAFETVSWSVYLPHW